MPSKGDRSEYFNGRKHLKREYDRQDRLKPGKIYINRKKHLAKYGLTPDQYDDRLKSQNGCCAICKSNSPKTSRIKHFCVDHCHKTGKIRGLLCSKCNRAIGLLEDSVEFLQTAIGYLSNDL